LRISSDIALGIFGDGAADRGRARDTVPRNQKAREVAKGKYEEWWPAGGGTECGDPVRKTRSKRER
jgi:hypothetical protein